MLSLITFLPQVFNTLLLSYRLYDRLELCLFSLTYSFVIFNKVTTSQYFLWYLIFLPILLPNIYLKWKTLLILLISWLITQAWWLYQAYQLEFQGKNTFAQVWFASILFGLTNVIILCIIMYHYRRKNFPFESSDKTAIEKKND